MKKIQIKSHAKLNLTLDILGIENGYHMLDSLVCSVSMFDTLTLTKRADSNIIVKSELKCKMEEDNTFKAVKLYLEAYGGNGVDIIVKKGIPLQGGVGGSSADVAAALRGMNFLYNRNEDLVPLADKLGSDSTYMLNGGFARLFKRGEVVKEIKTDIIMNFLLVKPRSGISTPRCFKLLDEKEAYQERMSDKMEKALINKDILAVANSLNNFLFLPSSEILNELILIKNKLDEFSPLNVNMSGSGSSMYAMFNNYENLLKAESYFKKNYYCKIISTKQTGIDIN